MQDPTTATKNLGTEPDIHRTASVRDSKFGIYCEVGARTKVAECTFGDFSYIVNDSDIIYTDVGKFCSIAAHTRINPGNHFTYRSSAYGLGEDDPAFFDWRRSFRCSLGHDVWIGHGAVVLPGVSMGNGAVAGAGSIVTKDVPAWSIVVGNPARVLRARFSDPIIEALERIAWWDWDRDRLRAAMGDFRSLSAEAFIEKYDLR
jgi:phosphonate metabolism protein (transferase hexapeptide repeat family)